MCLSASRNLGANRTHPSRFRRWVRCLSVPLALFGLVGTGFAQPAEQERPLSPAQIALFATPHLKPITQPETLEYRFERTGIEPFADTVTLHIAEIHPDGSKYVNFDFLTGEHHAFYPAVDNFTGNPLLMVFLEHDVQEMRQQIGVAATYFRNRVREAFVDHAVIADSTIETGGKTVPARQITLKPFTDDRRFEKFPAIRGKTYSFILSDQIPGQFQAIKVEMPADPETNAPAWSEQITFAGEKP
jgi:hypothetical protein